MIRNQDRSERRRKFLVYLIAFIMIGSTFGVIFFGFSSGTGSVKYNDFKFVNKGSFWSTKVNGMGALFTYFPTEIESINVSADISSRLKDRIEIDITSDYNDNYAESFALAQYQMGLVLNNFRMFTRNGFAGKNPSNFTIITCKDATNFVPVIYFKSGNETNIFLEDNCIIAEAATKADVIRVKDRLVYSILGVMG